MIPSRPRYVRRITRPYRRIIRPYGWPLSLRRYVSYTPARTNPAAFDSGAFWLGVLLAVLAFMLVGAGAIGQTAFDWMFGLGMLLAVFGGILHLRGKRESVCAEVGHDPWCARPGEWECRVCAWPLNGPDDKWRDLDAPAAPPHGRGQARYSDRR